MVKVWEINNDALETAWRRMACINHKTLCEYEQPFYTYPHGESEITGVCLNPESQS